MAKKEAFDQDVKARLNKIWINVFGQKKLLKDKKSGIIHVMFFYGFILVQFGAIDVIWKGLVPGGHLPLGPLYPGFKFFQEVVTLVILVAVVWAFYRRYIEKLVRLKRGFYAGLVLLFIGGLMLSVLLGNGMAMIWQGDRTFMVRAGGIWHRSFLQLDESTSCCCRFLYCLVDSLAASVVISSLCTAIQTRSPHCRSGKRISGAT